MPDLSEVLDQRRNAIALAYTASQMRDKYRREAFVTWAVLLLTMAFPVVLALAALVWWARWLLGWAWGG